jgi:hypothetical protein
VARQARQLGLMSMLGVDLVRQNWKIRLLGRLQRLSDNEDRGAWRKYITSLF